MTNPLSHFPVHTAHYCLSQLLSNLAVQVSTQKSTKCPFWDSFHLADRTPLSQLCTSPLDLEKGALSVAVAQKGMAWSQLRQQIIVVVSMASPCKHYMHLYQHIAMRSLIQVCILCMF